jgi:hypothetical protein
MMMKDPQTAARRGLHPREIAVRVNWTKGAINGVLQLGKAKYGIEDNGDSTSND